MFNIDNESKQNFIALPNLHFKYGNLAKNENMLIFKYI